MTYYIAGGSVIDSASWTVYMYLDQDGYDNGLYGTRTISDIADNDPYWRLGGSGGVLQAEIGLWNANKIIITATEVALPSGYDPTGKSDSSIATKKYVDDAAGAGVSDLDDLTDVGTVVYTSGYVLIADGVDKYDSGQLSHSQLSGVTSDQHHARSHTIISASDHSMNANKIIYSDNSSVITELSLGTANYYLKSQGPTSAPTFSQVAYSELSGVPSTLVKTDQANTYTAGMKQSVQANATTAGFRLVGYAGDPSSPTAGDWWYNTSTNRMMYRGSSANREIVAKELTQTLKNKTINSTDNTITITASCVSDFNSSAVAAVNAAGLSLATTKVITSANESLAFDFGRNQLGIAGQDYFLAGYRGITASTYALLQSSDWLYTYLNCKTGGDVRLQVGGSDTLQVTSTLINALVNFDINAHYMDIDQISAPSNPSSGTRRLFVDSGTGKLSVRTSAGTTVSLEEAGGGGGNLDDLDDVVITSVADDEVLAYDSTSSKWINQTAAEAGLATASALSTHTSDTGLHYYPNYQAMAVLVDTKAANTNGGTFTSGSWYTRDINTEQEDPGALMVLSSNRFRFTSTGYYYIWGSAPAFDVGRHQTRVYNYSTSTVEFYGSSEYANTSYEHVTRSFFAGIINVTSTAHYYEIQHRCEQTRADLGFGVASNFGTQEDYTFVYIMKLDS
jgi:hypothetical protein